jgi:hypothetical protein
MGCEYVVDNQVTKTQIEHSWNLGVRFSQKVNP